MVTQPGVEQPRVEQPRVEPLQEEKPQTQRLKSEQPQVERLVAQQPKLVNRLDATSGTGPTAPASPAVVPSVTTQNVEVQPPGGPLTLEESIRIALENHGDVGIAREQFESSAERITSARAAQRPQLNAEAGYNNRSITGSRTGLGTSSSNSTDASLVLRQNLFDSGVTRAQTRQAQANARGSLYGIGQARSAIAFQVAANYFEQLRTARLLELARQQVKLAEANLELVRAQAEAGLAARVDQTPIEVELRQRQFNVSQAENNARTAQVNFRNALGLGRGPVLPIQEVNTDAPPVAAIDAYFQEAQLYNPDLRIQRANVEAAQAGVDVATIRTRPQFSVDVAGALGIFDSPRRESGFTASVALPILDGGARRAERRAAQNQLQATQLREEQLAKDIAADIEAAYATAASARDRIAAARALETAALTNLEVAQEKYRQGLGITLEITTAQVQLFNAQISTIQALYDYYQAQSALERATGRRSGIIPTETTAATTAATTVTTPVTVPVTVPVTTPVITAPATAAPATPAPGANP